MHFIMCDELKGQTTRRQTRLKPVHTTRMSGPYVGPNVAYVRNRRVYGPSFCRPRL